MIAHNLVSLACTIAGGVGLLALLQLQERAAGRFLSHRLGWRSVLVTGWLGVPLHELSHLLLALLFGHRVIAWRLFDPDPVSGTLGYVRHAYSRRSPWQVVGTVFIALAPVVAGGAALAGLLTWVLPPAARAELWRGAAGLEQASGAAELAPLLWALAGDLATQVWAHRSVWLPLQCYLAACVASHMSPSRADLAGALAGAGAATLAAALGVALCGWQGVSTAAAVGLLVPLMLVVLLAGAVQGGYVALAALYCRLSGK